MLYDQEEPGPEAHPLLGLGPENLERTQHQPHIHDTDMHDTRVPLIMDAAIYTLVEIHPNPNIRGSALYAVALAEVP